MGGAKPGQQAQGSAARRPTGQRLCQGSPTQRAGGAVGFGSVAKASPGTDRRELRQPALTPDTLSPSGRPGSRQLPALAVLPGVKPHLLPRASLARNRNGKSGRKAPQFSPIKYSAKTVFITTGLDECGSDKFV